MEQALDYSSGKSTIMGMAFRMYDPENHLGKGEDLGITCALIPRNTDGVKADRRHDPLGFHFSIARLMEKMLLCQSIQSSVG